eukprot:s3046_g7.t1
MSDLDAKTLILGESDEEQWYAKDPMDDEHDGSGKKDPIDGARHEPDQDSASNAQPTVNGEKDPVDCAHKDLDQHVQGDTSNAQLGGEGEKDPKDYDSVNQDGDPENEEESTDSEVGGFGFMTMDDNGNVSTHGGKMSSYSHLIMARIQDMLANGGGNGASSSLGSMPVPDGDARPLNQGTRKMRRMARQGRLHKLRKKGGK